MNNRGISPAHDKRHFSLVHLLLQGWCSKVGLALLSFGQDVFPICWVCRHP